MRKGFLLSSGKTPKKSKDCGSITLDTQAGKISQEKEFFQVSRLLYSDVNLAAASSAKASSTNAGEPQKHSINKTKGEIDQGTCHDESLPSCEDSSPLECTHIRREGTKPFNIKIVDGKVTCFFEEDDMGEANQ